MAEDRTRTAEVALFTSHSTTSLTRTTLTLRPRRGTVTGTAEVVLCALHGTTSLTGTTLTLRPGRGTVTGTAEVAFCTLHGITTLTRTTLTLRPRRRTVAGTTEITLCASHSATTLTNTARTLSPRGRIAAGTANTILVCRQSTAALTATPLTTCTRRTRRSFCDIRSTAPLNTLWAPVRLPNIFLWGRWRVVHGRSRHNFLRKGRRCGFRRFGRLRRRRLGLCAHHTPHSQAPEHGQTHWLFLFFNITYLPFLVRLIEAVWLTSSLPWKGARTVPVELRGRLCKTITIGLEPCNFCMLCGAVRRIWGDSTRRLQRKRPIPTAYARPHLLLTPLLVLIKCRFGAASQEAVVGVPFRKRVKRSPQFLTHSRQGVLARTFFSAQSLGTSYIRPSR